MRRLSPVRRTALAVGAADGRHGGWRSGGAAGAAVERRAPRDLAAYVSRFVQADGRVVDPKAGGITTSEGQAYAMLRAVWMEDRPLFDRALTWATDHLNRGVRPDHLWAWKWDGRVVDVAFASDADQDAALALLMAARTWGDDGYLRRARSVLADLWDKGTLVAGGGGSRSAATPCAGVGPAA